MNFNTNILELKGIGEKNGALFHKLNIYTLDDLIHYYPRAYESFPDMSYISHTDSDKKCAILAKICSEPTLLHVKKYQILRFLVKDSNENAMLIRIFNMPYLKKSLRIGDEFVFYGKITANIDQVQMDQPKLYKKFDYEKLTKGYFPIYQCTKGLSNDSLKKYISIATESLKDKMVETFPSELLEKRGFPSNAEMIHILHNPDSMDELFHAKKRLAYEEFFFFLMSVKQNETNDLLKTELNQYKKYDEIDAFIQMLPFELTKSQLKVWDEIQSELYNGYICNRLIQGDVGCGKTMIAILCLYACALNGKQGAFMAPTEVLATQHYQSVSEMIQLYHLPFKPALLTGSVKAKEKKQIYADLKAGNINLVIGTHALLEDCVEFKDLSLVVTDEQHRFGVKQRTVLNNKGTDVHTIVMSATPIPRSLAMIMYGGLSVSTIPERPAERIPIKNAVVNIGYRKSAYYFMQKEINKGRQVYIICPMVESGISEDLENVVDYAEKIKPFFDEKVRIAILHGKMKGSEKNKIMDAFSNHEYDILISTTVIEVGINVPNATVMMIENAERFGLAALHQLRGRVGRGKEQSYCIFVDSTENEKSKKRLDILGKTNDGFEIANADLKMRGPGEMSGTLQSGDAGFVYADLYDDADMLYFANEDVTNLFMDDPLLQKENHHLLSLQWQKILDEGYLKTI